MNKRTLTALATALAASLALGATGCSKTKHSDAGPDAGGKNPATANAGTVVGGTPRRAAP